MGCRRRRQRLQRQRMTAVTRLCNGGRVGEGGGYSDSGGGVGTAPALQPWRME